MNSDSQQQSVASLPASNGSVDDDVAKFKLPLPLKHLGDLHDLMVRMHGKGVLRMKQDGEWLVMFRETKQPSPPNDQAQRRRE